MLKRILGATVLFACFLSPAFADLSAECQDALDAAGDQAGAIPDSVLSACAGESDTITPSGTATSLVAGWESSTTDAVTTTLDQADVLTQLSTGGAPTANFIGACEFGPDPDLVYCADSATTTTLFTVNVNDGTVNTVGTGMTGSAETPVSLDYDPSTGTMYMLTAEINVSASLHTVNLSNAALTSVGALSSACPIGGGFDGSGQGYYYDICDDSLYSFDKNTGSSALVGPLGFDANFGQGMDFDPETGECFLFAFNNTSVVAELRTCNTSTGSTTLVSGIGNTSPGGQVQLGGAGIPGPAMAQNVPAMGIAGIIILLGLVAGIAVIMIRRTA